MDSAMNFKPLKWGWCFAYRFSSDGKWIVNGKRAYFRIWFPSVTQNMKGISILIGGLILAIGKLNSPTDEVKK